MRGNVGIGIISANILNILSLKCASLRKGRGRKGKDYEVTVKTSQVLNVLTDFLLVLAQISQKPSLEWKWEPLSKNTVEINSN